MTIPDALVDQFHDLVRRLKQICETAELDFGEINKGADKANRSILDVQNAIELCEAGADPKAVMERLVSGDPL